MKKLNLNQNYAFFNKAQKITSILLIFVSLMFIANSCTKENELSKEDAIQLRTEMTPEQRVAAFTPVVNGTFDPAKTYTGQEAVLGVETVLNYEYGDFSIPCDIRYSLKDTFQINKVNGLVSDRVVNEIYNHMLQKMKCHYASVLGNKKELFVDMYLVNENSTQIQIGFINVFGSVASYPGNTLSFGLNDDWNAFKGKCIEPSVKNAPKKIADYTNWNLVDQFAVQAGTWYSDYDYVRYNYEDQETWYGLNSNDATPGDWVDDYFMWKVDGCNEFTNDPFYFDPCDGNETPTRIFDQIQGSIINPVWLDLWCIKSSDMNYYLHNAEFIAKKWENELSGNKKFLHIDIWYRWNPTDNNDTYRHDWEGLGIYAQRNYRPPFEKHKELGSCN